ncbi:MAG: CBS domain-containing protein [Nitrospirae bacterium]|nr:MAG: CBS domain-containing protein [Nitrospirota bacterium]
MSLNPRADKLATLDEDIQQLRAHLLELKTLLLGEATPTAVEDFDLRTEELLARIFGRSSPLLDAYEYAQLGEAGGLVNLPEEAPEGAALDPIRERLRQRQRVLESCVAELEARRAEAHATPRASWLAGPRISEYMTKSIRSISPDATLQEAGKSMQAEKVGALLVQSGDEFLGMITETELSREVIAQGLDPATTTVKTCMREPLLTIEESAPIAEAVRLMKEKGTRHLAVTENGMVVGVISVSDVLRYYSGVK